VIVEHITCDQDEVHFQLGRLLPKLLERREASLADTAARLLFKSRNPEAQV
jgi:hypothetical protein